MENKGLPLKIPVKLKFWYQYYVKGEDSFEDSLKPVSVISTVE
jgi:hypothetical protein